MVDPLYTLENLRVNRDIVLTIGVFDGVHLGHQHIISGVVRRAREVNGLSFVVTFHPHPQLVLTPSVQPAYLTTLEERLKLIAELGVDISLVLQFTRELAQVTASDFVRSLCSSFRLLELRVGPDFALGHKRQGTIPALRGMGCEWGFDVVAVEPWLKGGAIVSSTKIRERLRAGDVGKAGQLLGRMFDLSGVIVEGDRRGRTLGVPTANLEVDPQMLLPADGVYAVFACLDGRAHPAVCNIGTRPSFDNARRTFEVHLLDFQGDLYGLTMTVRFVSRLRGEIRFPDLSTLASQIKSDISAARTILEAAVAPC